jgi:hypothetical protein
MKPPVPCHRVLSQALRAQRPRAPCPTLCMGAASPRPSVLLGPRAGHRRPLGPTPSSTPWDCLPTPVCARQAGACGRSGVAAVRRTCAGSLDAAVAPSDLSQVLLRWRGAPLSPWSLRRLGRGGQRLLHGPLCFRVLLWACVQVTKPGALLHQRIVLLPAGERPAPWRAVPLQCR